LLGDDGRGVAGGECSVVAEDEVTPPSGIGFRRPQGGV